MSTEYQLKKSSPGDRLKAAREYLGISQLNLAISLGYEKYNPVKDIETGATKLKPPLARLIEKLYGVSEKWLLEEKGEMLVTRQDAKKETASIANQHDQNESIKILEPQIKNELMKMTSDILDSVTVYQPALVSNIRAFHRGVKGEIEVDSLKKEVGMLRNEISEIKDLILSQIGHEKKRASNDI